MTAPTSSNPLRSEQCEQHKAHGANWLKWLGHLTDKPDVRGLELGVWLGESTEWFMEHVCTHPTSMMDGVDHFRGSDEHRLAGIDCTENERIARERLARFNGPIEEGTRQRVELFKMTTDAFLLSETWNRPRYDFAYIDSAHDAMNVLRDSVLVFDLIKPGGIICWDDFCWNVMQDEVDRPKIAIEAFLKCYSRRLEVLGMAWQVCVKKIA